MHRLARRLLMVAACVAALLAPTVMASPAHARTRLLLVSIDGLPWSTFERHRDAFPNLARLAARGVVGRSKTVFPSMTWPSHASLLTGCLPKRHGVLGNRTYRRKTRSVLHSYAERKERFVRVPMLFDLAHARGLTTANVLWPNTREASTLTWDVPEVSKQRNYRRWTTPGLLDELQAAGLPVDRLGYYVREQTLPLDSLTRDIALHLVTTHQPDLLMVHFLAGDGLSHKYGPDTAEARWGLEAGDRALGDILRAYERAGILAETNVLVVSDHGFLKVTTEFDPDRLLYEAGITSSLAKPDSQDVRTVTNGHALFVYLLGPARTDGTRDKVIELFRARREIKRVYTPKAFARLGLPSPSDDPHMADLVVLAKPHILFRRIDKKGRRGRLTQPARIGGMHGYLPDHPELLTVFVAAGPGIKRLGDPVALANIDVAPTAARLLNLAFTTPIDGRVRTEILRAP